jgi:hypothetical protein
MQPLDKNTQDAAKGNTSGPLSGDTRPKALDERGAIGKQFTGTHPRVAVVFNSPSQAVAR